MVKSSIMQTMLFLCCGNGRTIFFLLGLCCFVACFFTIRTTSKVFRQFNILFQEIIVEKAVKGFISSIFRSFSRLHRKRIYNHQYRWSESAAEDIFIVVSPQEVFLLLLLPYTLTNNNVVTA